MMVRHGLHKALHRALHRVQQGLGASSEAHWNIPAWEGKLTPGVHLFKDHCRRLPRGGSQVPAGAQAGQGSHQAHAAAMEGHLMHHRPSGVRILRVHEVWPHAEVLHHLQKIALLGRLQSELSEPTIIGAKCIQEDGLHLLRLPSAPGEVQWCTALRVQDRGVRTKVLQLADDPRVNTPKDRLMQKSTSTSTTTVVDGAGVAAHEVESFGERAPVPHVHVDALPLNETREELHRSKGH
mmetsp:Transcript_107779/g.300416  ORF Transcript_107779/g.300416 Transcript_107779/m.300416 type:complete len:238 (+) Transcript_107779:904-1617(+)